MCKGISWGGLDVDFFILTPCMLSSITAGGAIILVSFLVILAL